MTASSPPGSETGRAQPNLTSTLTARLADEIVAGKLPPHTRLPTERSLMETYGVSRTVVREAIAALRADGLVETRQGSGAYVAAEIRNRPFRIDPKGLKSVKQVLDVMELRLCVEVEAAGIAARQRSKADIARMRKVSRAMARAIANGDPAVDLDFELHTVIGTTTGNPYFSSFLEFIGGIIIPRRTILIDDHEHGGTPYLARIQAQHEAIIAAIAKGDAGAARRAMRRHLAEGRDRYRRLVSKDPDEA
ncbi:MAG: FadR family transcriptional regulator [Bauldia sp.]|uniref:FadR/GntR family transcriptional regulator n=1 Tax=Bauldia sp. TaxID=2575872 RepID=UPI001D799274|nr:FadR/GntR family transcriptional regulator [Bauldia sp.]MCB1497731.1 FadR family transcriptional regulator [Bauldia sp.]